MTISRGRFAVLLAAGVVGLILAGCGGGSDSPSTAEPVSTASAKHHPHIPVEGGTTVVETPGKP